MNYINKLTYVSYDGFMEMDNLRNNYDSVLELDCKDITTKKSKSRKCYNFCFAMCKLYDYK